MINFLTQALVAEDGKGPAPNSLIRTALRSPTEGQSSRALFATQQLTIRTAGLSDTLV